MTPRDLYRTCRVSAYRLETLQRYIGDEDDRQRAFLAGEELPPPGPGKLDDLQLISELRRAGRRVGRVHIVSLPLTDYMRYELAAYAENAAAGEEIRIADAADTVLAEMTKDFAIFDSETDDPQVILFDYSTDGLICGYEHVTDRSVVDQRRRQFRTAYERSVPLTEFVSHLEDTAA